MDLQDEWKRKLGGRNISPMPPFPTKLKVDICGLCNQSCIFCPSPLQRRTQGNIDDALLRRVIGEAYSGGARELAISGTGETLLNPKLEEYIVLAKSLGYEYVFINTNGALLDEQRTRSLLESGLDSVKISVNAGDAETYRLVHGADCFENIIENIKFFDSERALRGKRCQLYVSFIAIKETISQAEKLSAILSGHTDAIVVAHANNRGGGIVVENSMLGNDEYSFRFPCGQLFDTAVVLAEGYLTLCCQDFDKSSIVADLRDMSITTAWNCKKFVNFRKKYLEKDFAGTLCNNCLFARSDLVVPLTPEVAHYPIDESAKKDRARRINILQSRLVKSGSH